jgi:hypothetical protein
MTRQLLGLLIVTSGLVVGGCKANGEYDPPQKPTALAANAANAEFPRDVEPVRDLSVTATVSRATGKITVRNFTNKTFAEPRLWINQIYVLRLPTIGPDSVLAVNRADLFDSAGRSLATQPVDAIRKVQLETERNLIDVQGPQME